MIEQFKNTSSISNLTDPFKSDKVTSISLDYEKEFLSKDKTLKWKGAIKFRSGNTSGRHVTKCHLRLEDCLAEIQSTIESI